MNKKKNQATTSKVAQTKSSFSLLSLSLIDCSSFNPRKIIDETGLEELASSIKEKGILQPIVVRPVGERFEIVCGERRYRASLLADKKEIPAMIRELSDDEAFEFAITENLQRKDVSPIEEAAAFKLLIDAKNYDVPALVIRFGKSESYIRGRLRLNTLFHDIANLLNGDVISLGSALELSKYPIDIQEAIYNDHLKEQGWNCWADLKVSDLAKRIESNYTTAINSFNFDKTECISCIYNSNSSNLFASENNCGNCSNKECLRAKITDYMVDKAIKIITENPLALLCKSRYNTNDKVVEILKKKGYEIGDYQNCIEEPEEPEMPERDEDDSDEDFKEALIEYENEKAEYLNELAEWNRNLEAGNYVMIAVIEAKDVTLCYVERHEEEIIQESPFETQIKVLDKKDERNKEIAREKTIESVKACLKDSAYVGEFSMNEEKAMYFFMLSKVKREHYKFLDIDSDTYYISTEDKMRIISNLTNEVKNLIRRDYLVDNFSNAFRYDETANFLMQFALQHFPEELSKIERLNNEVYESRHKRIEERKMILEAQEKKVQQSIDEVNSEEFPNNENVVTELSKEAIEAITEPIIETALILVEKENDDIAEQEEEIEELVAEEV